VTVENYEYVINEFEFAKLVLLYLISMRGIYLKIYPANRD